MLFSLLASKLYFAVAAELSSCDDHRPRNLRVPHLPLPARTLGPNCAQPYSLFEIATRRFYTNCDGRCAKRLISLRPVYCESRQCLIRALMASNLSPSLPRACIRMLAFVTRDRSCTLLDRDGLSQFVPSCTKI